MVHHNYSTQALYAAFNLIKNAQHITLLTHFNPDADGVSACAAFAHILEKLGKKVETVYPSKLEGMLARQPKIVYINTHQQTPDLVIAFDTANYNRLYYPEAFKSIPLINIDHHVSSDIKTEYNFLNSAASSTCEELLGIIQAWDPKLIDTYVAECLLFGILYDTQVFQTQATTPETLRTVAILMDSYGVNLFDLKNELLADKNPHIISLWGRVLSNVIIAPNSNAAWACIRQSDLKEFNLTAASLVGFSNFLAQISDIDVSIVFFETSDGKVKASLRSKRRDVNLLAGRFGGGGHKNASGITSTQPFDTLVHELTQLL